MAHDITLDNGHLTAVVFLPNADQGHYRGARFDWSGMVARVEHRGHAFFGPWNPQPDPTSHDGAAVGTASEFSTPLGYDEAGAGEPFVKIGVGVLERASDIPYAFYHPYAILETGVWTVRAAADRVRFEQTLAGPRGWGYRLNTEIRLLADRPALTILRRLTNTGEKSIATDFYDHHFFHIDETPIGPETTLSFPFGRRTLGLSAPLQEPFWTELDGLTGKPSDNGATFTDRRSGASVTFAGDRAPFRYAVWGMANCLCPEPFVKIAAPPGKSVSWKEEYIFHAP